jgi:hypothetical protein
MIYEKKIGGRKFTLRQNGKFMTTMNIRIDLTEYDYKLYSLASRLFHGSSLRDYLENLLYPYNLQTDVYNIDESDLKHFDDVEIELVNKIKELIEKEREQNEKRNL